MAGVNERSFKVSSTPNQSVIPLFLSFLFAMDLAGGRVCPSGGCGRSGVRGMSLLGLGSGRGGDNPWPFLHVCHEMFHVFILPAVGWAQESATNAAVGVSRAGNLSRCGNVGHWGVVVGSSNPQGLAEQPLSAGNEVPSRKTILIFPPYKRHATWFCVCLTCPAASLLSSSFLICLRSGSGCPLGVIAFGLQHSSPCPPDRVFRD